MSEAAQEDNRYDAMLDRFNYWTYSVVKLAADKLGLTVPDLLAMTSKNDPFYVGPAEDQGMPAVLAEAQWIADLWPRLGYPRSQRVHDRRIHYKLLSLRDVTLPEGKVAGMAYGTPRDAKGNDISWGILQGAVRNARYLHRIPYDAIEDQRNPAAANTNHLAGIWQPPDPAITVERSDENEEVRLPEFPGPPDYNVQDYATAEYSTTVARQLANQRYHLEVWCEKTTMDDILLPWCQAHGAVYVTAQGQMTLTGAWEAAERIRTRGKPAVILYISDFDKSGQSMPPAIARKIERFLRMEYKDQDPPAPPVIVQQVALTFEQVKQYNLPDVPIITPEQQARLDAGHVPDRPTEGEVWYQRYHKGKVELDALEVFRPGELRRLLNDAAAPYWDNDLGMHIAEAEMRLQNDLSEKRRDVLEQHEDQLTALEERWNTAVEEARKLLEGVWQDIQAEHATIAEELKDAMPDVTDYPLPEPPEADPALAESALFDSRRTYWQQLKRYKRYQQEHVMSEE